MINKLYITAISLVLAVILGIVLLWPKYQDIQELNSAIKEKEVELQSKEDYFSQLRGISQRLTEYEEGLSKVSSAFPQDPSLPSLFNFFKETASQTGLLLEDIKMRGIKEREGGPKRIKEIHSTFTLSGLYPDFKNFLSALEKSARLIEVEKISFSSPKELREPFSFQVNIKTHSY